MHSTFSKIIVRVVTFIYMQMPFFFSIVRYCPQTQEIRSYNVLVPEARHLPSTQPGYPNILSPEMAVPTRMGCSTTRSHCALHMLGKAAADFS